MISNHIECPADFILINERKVRLTAAAIFILAIIYLFTRFWAIPVFLALDFFARGFNLGRLSLLNIMSGRLVKVFDIKPKLIDQAPKRFSAKIGLLFSVLIVVLFFLDFIKTSLAIAFIVTVFAFLECSVGFCAGCYVYSFYRKILRKSL